MKRFGAFTLCAYACQFFFGGWFLFHGLNYWTHFYIDPTIRPGPGLLPALEASGLLALVKAVEIIVGFCMLSDRFVPLAAVVAFPVTVVIAYVNSSHHTAFGIVVGIIILALNSIIALGHLGRFLPMLNPIAGIPRAPATAGVPAADRESTARSGLGLPLHLAAACLGIACAAAITFATLRPR